MPSIACDIPKTAPTQDVYIPIAPKAASTRARDGYVVIAPKSVAMTSKFQSFVTSSNYLPPNFPPYNVKSHVTRSTRARAASESYDSHTRHRKSPRGLGKAAVNERRLKSGTIGTKNMEGLSLTPARWDGYVHIAPKGDSTISKSQDTVIPSSSLSPSLPSLYDKSVTTRASSIHSTPEYTKALNAEKIAENPKKAATKESSLKHKFFLSDSTGAITPALLARYHLPGILIKHGPLAIRHIMSFLTAAVPGFSKISPAKSRRLVVSALEKRVVEDSDGEIKSDVVFEKVGWGRWNAKINNRSGSGNKIMIYPSSPSSCKSDSIIFKKRDWNHDGIRFKASRSSLHDDSISYSHIDDVDIDMAENESDKISFDSQETCSSSDSLDEDEIMSDNSSDTTDDEDWAALGAAALRAASYSTSNTSNNYFSYLAKKEGCQSDIGTSASIFTKTCPRFFATAGKNNSHCDMTPNSQEREAVEALMHLGSV